MRETSSAAPGKIGGYRQSLLDQHADMLRGLTTAEPGITLAELKAALAQ